MWLRKAALLACLAAGAVAASQRADAAPPVTVLSADGESNITLAQGYLQAGKPKEAMERAQAALMTDPESANVHALLGLVHSLMGESRKADKEFSRALKLAPNDGAVLNAHAAWLCEQGQYAQADVEFRLALNDGRYPNLYQPLTNAARCASKAGKLALAETYFRLVLATAPDDPSVLLFLADLELRQGNALEARAFIQRRSALGADAQTLELAARIEDTSGNQEDAARNRQRLKEEFPGYVPTGEGVRKP